MSDEKSLPRPDSPNEIGAVRSRVDIEPVSIARVPVKPDNSEPHDDALSGGRGAIYMPTADEAGYTQVNSRPVKLAPQCKRCQGWDFWEVQSQDGVILLQCVSCRSLYRVE